MRIALAYPYEGHKPDDVIEVDDNVGRRMIRDGKARPADGRRATRSRRTKRPAEPAPTKSNSHSEEAD